MDKTDYRNNWQLFERNLWPLIIGASNAMILSIIELWGFVQSIRSKPTWRLLLNNCGKERVWLMFRDLHCTLNFWVRCFFVLFFDFVSEEILRLRQKVGAVISWRYLSFINYAEEKIIFQCVDRRLICCRKSYFWISYFYNSEIML